MNQIAIMGRLTRDPELRETANGTPVASFSLAVDRGYTPKDGGERQTDFINCVAWRGTAQFVSKYFVKGKMAAVTGRLQIRSYTDKDGNNRQAAEVVADNIYFTGDNKGSDGNRIAANPKDDFAIGNISPVESSDFAEIDMDDGDLPF